MQSKIPTSKLARGRVVGKAMLKIGVSHSKGVVKRAFLVKEKHSDSKTQTHEEIAKVIIDTLGELKGVSVKVAQQVALGFPFLPEAYLTEIYKSFNAIPPLNKALIRKLITQELGETPQILFDSFESDAFGGASLGQVHLAEYDGEEWAIKVQYPGIAKSIESDLGVLKFGLKRFAKGQNIDHLMEEITQRLSEEVDYEREAQNCEYFRSHLNHNLLIIPKINRRFSTKRVLTSLFLEGMNFEKFLDSNPTQKARNHYAQLIFDIFFLGFYQLQMIHADPNPGNFIFMENKRLGLIDFGCVKRVNDMFLDSFSKLHHRLIEGECDEVIMHHYANLGMIDRMDEITMLHFYREVIKPLDRIYIEVFREDSYDS